MDEARPEQGCQQARAAWGCWMREHVQVPLIQPISRHRQASRGAHLARLHAASAPPAQAPPGTAAGSACAAAPSRTWLPGRRPQGAAAGAGAGGPAEPTRGRVPAGPLQAGRQASQRHSVGARRSKLGQGKQPAANDGRCMLSRPAVASTSRSPWVLMVGAAMIPFSRPSRAGSSTGCSRSRSTGWLLLARASPTSASSWASCCACCCAWAAAGAVQRSPASQPSAASTCRR